MNYFISDLHFGHENVLYFDGRPFTTIEEHDKTIIENWNSIVTDDDDIYILGDVSFFNVPKTIEIYSTLKGKKHLIVGNHDKRFMKSENFKNLFVDVCDYKELFINDHLTLVLSHYPILAYKNLFRGWIHLYGHVHNSFEWGIAEHNKRLFKELYSKKDGNPESDVYNAYNVGCMLPYMNYKPKTLEQIIDAYNKYENFDDFVNKPIPIGKN